MEFWGVEVKPGVPLKVKPDHGQLIHVSQAALGEAVKDVKGAKNIPLRMKIDDKDFVIGSLKPEERTQLMFDLVFEREFELSHDWKNGSVYFIGYVAADEVSEDDDYSSGDIDSSDESEDEPLENLEKASANGVVKVAKGPAVAVKTETKKDDTKKDESSDSDDDDDVSEDGSDDEDIAPSLGGDSSDDLSGDDSEEDDSEEEELPKNVQQSKKRPIESPQAAPVSAKKAKSATPEKTGNKGQKASGKNATGKTPPGDKSKQSPKSGGQFSGKSGNKSFNSKTGKGKYGGK